MLKQRCTRIIKQAVFQPPLGGCVLKHRSRNGYGSLGCQPPLGGCVLKLRQIAGKRQRFRQPPLGGCVLKHCIFLIYSACYTPAAFRRLCVETYLSPETGDIGHQPPLGGCVLKH